MRFRRYRCEGGSYFFTVVTLGRRPLLIRHVDRLRSAFRRAMQRQPFEIESIVVLPDHLHTMWRLPPGDADYSRRWQLIKHHFSTGLPPEPRSWSRIQKRERGVWQRRYWEHLIRDEEDWRRHMNYIHFNPVKHGLCDGPGEWPHSSFRRMVQQGFYPPNWGRVAPDDQDGLDCE